MFFELIRVAIGTQVSISRLPSANEWDELFELAKKQSLVGITFIGLQKLGADADPSLREPQGKLNSGQALDEAYARIGISEDTYFTWVGVAAKINVQNELVNQQCAKVQEELGKAGFASSILKGQGVGSLYNDLSQFRQSGDIDVWVDADSAQVLQFVNKLTPNRNFTNKHASLNAFANTEVELHWIPSTMVNPFVNSRLKRYYRSMAALQMDNKVMLNGGVETFAPTAEFQCVHLMLHLFDHFLYEGIGLRQLMDLYFAMKTPLAQETKHCIVERYRDFKVYDFVCGINWVIMYVFGERDCLLCEHDEKLGRELLREIMEGGNFGKYSKENEVKDESFGQRMMRRLKRRVRLMKYSPWDVLLAPISKVQFLLWKQYMIMKYKL